MKDLIEIISGNQHPAYNVQLSIGLLFLRVVPGLFLLLHGLPKLGNPTSWMGDAFPGILQVLAVFFEVIGGLALIVGFLVPLFSAGIVITMVFATIFGHLMQNDPLIRLTVSSLNEGSGANYLFFPKWFVLAGGRSVFGTGSAELVILFLVIALCLVFTGGGKYAIDHTIAGYLQKVTSKT